MAFVMPMDIAASIWFAKMGKYCLADSLAVRKEIPLGMLLIRIFMG